MRKKLILLIGLLLILTSFNWISQAKPDCDLQCGQAWADAMRECRDGGGSYPDCLAAANAAKCACYAECNPNPVPSCE